MGSVDVHGVPTTQYDVDGTVFGTYTAPVIAPGFFIGNQTYFISPNLSPGEHQLTITNLNGTTPNVFWLDYIAFLPVAPPEEDPTTTVPVSVTTSPSIQAPSTSSGSSSDANGAPSSLHQEQSTPTTTLPSGLIPTSNLLTSREASSSGSTTAPSGAFNTSIVPASLAKSTNIGAIVGGAIGGGALLVLSGFLLAFYRRWRQTPVTDKLGDADGS